MTPTASFERPAYSRYRWVVCGLLFFATTCNYLDRQVISYLKEFFCRPVALGGFGWSDSDYGHLTGFFTLFYAGATIFAGWLMDRLGSKIGLALSLSIWSVFGIVNAFVGRLVMMHVLVRSAFGFGEGGNFPASIKTIAEWFPKRERAFATAIFNSGSNFGPMVAAVLIPWIMVYFGDQRGWKMAFIITGAVGFIWLIFWFWLYETPERQRRLSQKEYDYIHVDDEAPRPADVPVAPAPPAAAGKVSWSKLLTYRQTWAFFAGKFMTDGIWWFYLFWLPDYLQKQFGMTKQQVTLPTFIVYGIAIIGSIYGGRVPYQLINRGMAVYKARMTTMLVIAIFPLAVLLTQYFGDVARFGHWSVFLAVGMICIGTTAHQAWSANLFTTVSDMFPKKSVASVIGIGTTGGGIGGFIVQLLPGALSVHFGGDAQKVYLVMFVICAVAYLIAWVIIKTLVPQHRPITDL